MNRRTSGAAEEGSEEMKGQGREVLRIGYFFVCAYPMILGILWQHYLVSE